MFAAKLNLSGTPSAFEPNLVLVPEQVDESDRVVQIAPETFAARFCVHRGIKLEDFEETLFLRALYRPARLLRPLLEKFHDYFAADRAFITMIGRARNMKEVEAAMVDFADCRSRFRFLRKRLKLRVSASIVWMLTNRLMKAPPPPAPMLLNSRSPFPSETNPSPGTRNVASASNAELDTKRAKEELEISRLRQEVDRLKAQCELLKRATGLLGGPQPPPTYS